MAWTKEQKKAHSQRMKAMWAKKALNAMDAVRERPYAVLTSDSHSSGPQFDMVSSPPHYTFGRYEVIDVLSDWFPKNPLLWQVGKYIARAEHKGNAVQDLKKAKFYLEREIERIENAQVKP